MAQVSVTVNARRYEIACDDGQESHVFRLAEDVDRRIGQLVASLGQVGEARLLLLAGLLLADELEEMRDELARLRDRAAGERAAGADAGGDGGALGDALHSLADRIEAMTQRINASQTIAAEAQPS